MSILKSKSLIALGLLLAVVGWLWVRQRDSQMPPYKVTTVANARFGNGEGELGQTSHSARVNVNFRMMGLAPCAVNETGHIFIVDIQGILYEIDATGKMTRRANCPAARAVEMYCGPEGTLYIADAVQGNLGPRLIKAKPDGTVLWRMAQFRVRNRNTRTTSTFSQLPNDKGGQMQFNQVVGLFTSDNGDVFINDYDRFMYRFNANGHFIARYDLELRRTPQRGGHSIQGTAYSAIATRDGSVYSQSIRSHWNRRGYYNLVIYSWKRPHQRITREVDVSKLEKVAGGDIMLMGADEENNLYFQYIYNQSANGKWNGPMALARVGSDNVARKIFDIYEYYKDSAVKRIGDLIYVSDKGELYLEMKTATHYRIDKISFPQK